MFKAALGFVLGEARVAKTAAEQRVLNALDTFRSHTGFLARNMFVTSDPEAAAELVNNAYARFMRSGPSRARIDQVQAWLIEAGFEID